MSQPTVRPRHPERAALPSAIPLAHYEEARAVSRDRRPKDGDALTVATRVTPPRVKEAAATDGLTEDEVHARRARGEGNTFSLPTSRSYRQILRANFFTMMNAILMTLGIILIALGQVTNGMLTAGIVFINGLIAIWQEVRAKRQRDHIGLLLLCLQALR